MLKRRDNFGSDAAALPQRNIFAAPAATPVREGPPAGGVFDAAAACRSTGSAANTARDHDVAAASPSSFVGGRGRAVVFARACAGVAATVSVAVVLFGLPADRAAPRAVPAERPAEPAPAPAQRARPRPARRSNAPQARPRRSRSFMDGKRRRRPRVVPRRTAPTAAPARPPVVPAAPRRAAPQAPEPARVPADSPPEFL
jgi:hypothetical protein